MRVIEYRTVNGGAVGADGGLDGTVTPFGVETIIGDLKRGGFREEVAHGTFTKTLQERNAVLIHNHDTAMPMASTAVPEGEEGHLSLVQESDRLRAIAPQPIDTSYTRDVRNLAKAKILGMSFGFEVTKDDWFDDQGRTSNPQVGTKRIIREVKLYEVSTTAFPAYGTTMGTVSARDSVAAARGITETRTDRTPETPEIPETRDDPDGIEYAAMRQAIELINNGHPDEAVTVLQACLPDDTEAGSATSDDEDERADMALLAENIRLATEF